MRSGLIVINKPSGISSRECVNRVHRAARDRRLKVGHGGTLDPMAKGVLLVAVGEATRLVEQFHDLDKSYSAEFEFGKSSETLDSDSHFTVHDGVEPPTREQLLTALNRWVGPAVAQRPPRYSAIKIDGKRAYDMARSGVEFEMATREVAIHELTLTHFDYPYWHVDMHCGSGTYVRSIGQDVATDLSNYAIMTGLVRTAIGPFQLADAHDLDALDTPDDVESRLRSPIEGLPTWNKVIVTAEQITDLRHGRQITLHVKQFLPEHPGGGWLALDDQGQLVAIIEPNASGTTRPLRVFQSEMAPYRLTGE